MSHAVAYNGQYFRVEVVEVVNLDEPRDSSYASWCSDGFDDLSALPERSLAHFVEGPPLRSSADARRHAHDWIKLRAGTPAAQAPSTVRVAKGVVYSVWLFKGERSSGFDFDDFSDAKAFAAAAEQSRDITKIGITNNESPQYLTIWERPPERR